MLWRWDQGRTQYFLYENIRQISRALVKLDGVSLNEPEDPLRAPLTLAAGLPFAPNQVRYRVWRNYARVFEASLLATSVGDRLVCTTLCHEIAPLTGDVLDVDDYLAHFVRVFNFPSPVFAGFTAVGERVYPVAAILKLLLANTLKSNPRVTLEEVLSLVIGNRLTGLESVDSYGSLSATGYAGIGEEARQVRELMRFISQFTFLTWERTSLLLDVQLDLKSFEQMLVALATPLQRNRKTNRSEELLALGSRMALPKVLVETGERSSDADEEFAEGARVRRSHLRLERNRNVRRSFFARASAPNSCDACRLKPPEKYPWVGNILELHHLLPLASALRVAGAHTVLEDLVPLCPTCHKAVHVFYRTWLSTENASDFPSASVALSVYEEAKSRVAS